MSEEIPTGIYKIQNLINSNVYIGQAKNIKSRWQSHTSDLKYNRHGNKHLQNAWNKYGKENFKFEVLEECNVDELDIREQLTLGNDYAKGRIWINNGVISKMIYPNELDKYLCIDFNLGRLKKNKEVLNNE